MAEVSSWLTERLKLQVSAEMSGIIKASEGATFLGSAGANSGHGGGREGVELVCRLAD